MRLTLLLALLLPSLALAGDIDDAVERSTDILREVGGEVPRKAMKRADCVSAFRIGSGGFIVGASGGTGLLSCKTKKGTWSAPVVLDIGGPSIGAQIGGSSMDLVMVYLDVDDVEELVHTNPIFKVGAKATAGSKSTGISIGGNPEAESGVVTVYRSRGLQAAAVAEGLAVDPDEEKTKKLYGSKVDLEAALIEGTVPVPAKAKAFHAAVVAWAGGK